MTTSEIASYLSLALAIVFWLLTTKQANDAKKTLGDIKTDILAWQSQLNKAAIDLISSRPEVIAKETELAEIKSLGEFSKQMSDIIKTLSSNPLPKESGGEYQLAILDKLLLHHKTLILGKLQLTAQIAGYQSGHPLPQQLHKPDTKQNKTNEY